MSFEVKNHSLAGHAEIRAYSRGTTWDYIAAAAERGLLGGRVLDYGCGPQPYKTLVTGEYFAFDPGVAGFEPRPMPGGTFDAALLTYVLGYTFDPRQILADCAARVRSGGHIVGAYAISWMEIEPAFVCSLTYGGVEQVLGAMSDALYLVDHRRGSSLTIGNFTLQLSGLFIARKR